jgi:hypothetical protein
MTAGHYSNILANDDVNPFSSSFWLSMCAVVIIVAGLVFYICFSILFRLPTS